MAQTLQQAQTRLAALPAEMASARASEASTYGAFRTAQENHAAALATIVAKEEELRVVKNHLERLTGQPA
jgi:hypothetical protein